VGRLASHGLDVDFALLEKMLAASGPTLVDVAIDRSIKPAL